jgi:hypothetical protein
VSQADRAVVPPLVPLGSVAAGAIRLITDDSLNGRVLVLDRGEPPLLLDVGTVSR